MSGGTWHRLVVVALGGLTSYLLVRVAMSAAGDRPRWRRRNFRDQDVSLVGGPVAAVGVLVGTVTAWTAAPALAGSDLVDDVRRVALAMAIAAAAAGAVGVYDDLAGDPASKGFRGHLRALRERRVTSGLVKVVVIVAAAAAAAATLAGGRPGVQLMVDAGVIAGTANMANLLDLRPGRALKLLLAVGVPVCLATAPAVGLVTAWPSGVTAGLFVDDVRERTMLGDGGANALGSALGVALAAAGGLMTSAAVLVGLVAATALSEVVSFSRVIDATPPLRWLDHAGRRP